MNLPVLKSLIILKNKIFGMGGDAKSVAKGFALGSFIGMIPIPGLQVFVALGIASLLNVNKKAACLAVFNTNLFTGVFIFAFNYWLGKTILGFQSSFNFYDEIRENFFSVLYHSGRDTFISLLLGGFITGTVSAFIAYYIVLVWYKRKKMDHVI